MNLSPGSARKNDGVRIAPEQPAYERVDKQWALTSRSLRVLVVDADPDSADELSRSIANWGHEVRWICDSTAALRLALDHRAEVALLDVSLTEMCAYAAAHALRSEPGLRGCFLLALRWHTDRRRDPQFQPTDVDLYLAKPVDLLVLETVLALEADRLSR